MAKRKSKKKTDFQSDMVKTVFLTGTPNKEKRSTLQNIQTVYNQEINRFVALLIKEETLLLPLLNNSHKNADVRLFEKTHRSGLLTSAYSQSAFDYAMDVVSTRLLNIKNELYGIIPSPFTSSKVLFAASLQHQSKQEIMDTLQMFRDSYEPEDKKAFYQGLWNELAAIPDKTFLDTVDELNMWFQCVSDEYKVPFVTHSQVRLVSTLFTLKKSKTIKQPFVMAISVPWQKRKRIEIPLSCSFYAKKQLESYGASGTVNFTIRKDGVLVVSVPYKKKLSHPATSLVCGVDVGITDMLHTSNGQAIGTFTDCEQFYKETVEPLFGFLATLRNRKRALCRFLKKHRKTLPEDILKNLRDRIDRLETEIRRCKKPYRKRNQYRNQQSHAIKQAVDTYIQSLNGNHEILTSLEFLDIQEFHKVSKKQNQYLSNFARGTLSLKLMQALNWEGYDFIQVEPAYTSQTCPICSNVDAANRNKKRFSCTCCGYQADADYVGAVNIKQRATDEKIDSVTSKYSFQPKMRHHAIKEVLRERHQSFWNTNMLGFGI